MAKAIAESFADMIRYKSMVDDGVMMLKDGCLMAGYRLYGTDLDSATPAQREGVALRLNAALRRLDENYMVHVISLRAPSAAYPSGEFSEKVSKLMDDERKAYFTESGNGYETRVYCFLTWQPPVTEVKGVQKVLKAFKKREEEDDYLSDSVMREFNEVFENFAASLSMTFTGHALEGVEFLAAVNECVNGEFRSPHVFSENPYDLDTMFARDLVPGSDYMIYDNKYIAVISLSTLPDFSSADMLSELNRMPFEQMWSLRFMPLDYATAAQVITKQFKMWHQRTTPFLDQILHMNSGKVDLNAAEKANDAQGAQQELDAGVVSFGNLTNTIIIRGDDIDELRRHVLDIQNLCTRCSFGTMIEHYNAVDAFVGALPGHGYENCRRPLVNTLNTSHIVPIGATWTGPEFDPCPFYPPNSPCLIQTGTRGRQPFRLPMHVGDVGHTLILGPTGAGKSTLLATLASQFDRYPNSQLFVFDKGRSMYPLIKAMENSQYYFLGRDDSPALCPLAALDTPGDRAWGAEFIETLVALNGGKVSPAQRRLIQETLSTIAESTTDSSERTLSAVYIDLQDRDLKDALMSYTNQGLYGRYLDGESTALAYSKATAFELEDLMNLGQKVVVPTLSYLFHEIEKRLDGRPTLIILDEAWLMLDTPVFAARIKEWLKVLRKANAAVFLATQALMDVVRSEVGPAILDSCPTKILLPNSQINSAEMTKLYAEQLQLNSTEISIIATAIPKREYFYLSPEGRRLFSLNLGRAQLAFVGSSGREDLARVDELIRSYGEHGWVRHWLEEKVPGAVPAWDALGKGA